MANIVEKRLKRLEELKCPMHGQAMIKKVIAGATPADDAVHFSCNQSRCEIVGSSASPDGPIRLAEQFMALLDPGVGQLPIQTYNQQRGIRAADVAALALTNIAFVHRVETGTDIGVDFICELRVDGKPTGRLFNVQCKALPISFENDGDHIDVDIKVATARYWLEQACPTVLLVADPESGLIYWTAPLDALRAKPGDWRLQETVTVRVRADTGFMCFAMVPEELTKIAAQGIKSAGNAFGERLYTLKQEIVALKQYGINRESKQLAPALLADDSPMTEVRETLLSLLELQNAYAADLQFIILGLAGSLWPIAQDVYRRGSALANRPDDWMTDSHYLKASATIEHAMALTVSQQAGSAPMDMKQLLLVLNALEELHQELLMIKDVNDDVELEGEYLHDELSDAWSSLQ